MRYFIIDEEIWYQGKLQKPRKVELFNIDLNYSNTHISGYDEDSNLYLIEKEKLIIEK